MASRTRPRFSRTTGKKNYNKIFVIAAEGARTEPQYFTKLSTQCPGVIVTCLAQDHKSSPLQVLATMRKYLEKEGLKKSEEAWLVVDKDNWPDGQLSELHCWSGEKENYGFALSNPKFELWLLLYFEDVTGFISPQMCSRKLKDYDLFPSKHHRKDIDFSKISDEQMLAKAIERAKKWDNPPCDAWPRTTGSTVYKLVENILKSGRDR